ncbi:hypothetical protein [Zhihengliuella flava]|uniref:Uncharacterized protein n=1 Tax=Zhihengliuella flava TaxID=1285193 RepID=A0A931DAB4_9MICC|nr:hypothetical protein [Zhihengliuella flava]MBG6083258.1 hypothetical protein [Zhihengliuella flava]
MSKVIRDWLNTYDDVDAGEKMANAIRAVLELHKPAGVDPNDDWCVIDEEPYPCPTVSAISDELDCRI